MVLNYETFVLAVGLVVVLAYAGHLLFKRFGLPDVLILVIFGMLLGPGLGWLPVDALQALVPILGVLAIIMILFDGGLRLNLRTLFTGLAPAFVLAAFAFAAASALVGGLHQFLFGGPILVSLLLGLALAGSSSVVIVALAKRLALGKRTQTILALESVFTDIFVIVGVLSLAAAISLQRANPQSYAIELVQLLALGSVIGVAAGFLWSHALAGLQSDRSYHYMLTMAVLALVYVVTDYLHGSPAIAALAFGIIVGNTRVRTGRERRGPVFDVDLIHLHDEMVFFVRAFFFVTLGALIDPTLLIDTRFQLFSGLLLLAVVAARLWAVLIVQTRIRWPRRDLLATWLLLGRGLEAAVVSSFPFVVYGIEETKSFPVFALVAIVLTNLAMWVATLFLGDPERTAPTEA